MNEKKKTGVIAIAAIMAVLFFAIGSAQAAEVTRLFNDVESGVAGWTEETLAGVPTDSLWHITETRANSPTHSWWYGQEATGNYDTTGIANSGCLVSPVINLNGDATAATLEYWTWWQTETSSSWDLKKVYVRPVGAATGTCIETLPGGECPNTAGEVRTLDLSAYKGDDVQILFCFNTGDGTNNEFEGWFVDDIKVLVDVPTPPPPIGGLEVNKTVWNNDTQAWVDEIPCAAIGENYTFRCEIHNNGTENLTKVRFWDIMSSSLEYIGNSARMMLPSGEWIPDIIDPADPANTFKQKYLHLEAGDLINPVTSNWHELYPTFCENYTLLEWHDTGDDCRISPCDQINMSHGEAFEWYHVDKVVYTLNVTPCEPGGDPIYLESTWDYDYDEPDITQPVDTKWHEVYPVFCENWTIVAWTTDTETEGILDFCDNIRLRNERSGEEICYHVEEVAPDIIVSREYLIDELAREAPPVELKNCETIIIEFNATVVENGYDCNNQFAKALNESSKWVYGNDTACVNAPAQSVYFDPSEGSAIYGGCVNYSLMVDACGIKSGDVYIYYTDCVNCTWTWNPDFDTPITETVGIGWDWHLWFYVDEQSSSGLFNLGTLTCCCDDYESCESDLELTGELYGAFGHAKDGITWEDGSFECIASPSGCGDLDRSGVVDIDDVVISLNLAVCGGGTLYEIWAGDVVDCDDGLTMGDVALLHNHVTYLDAVPPYTLNCCAPE